MPVEMFGLTIKSFSNTRRPDLRRGSRDSAAAVFPEDQTPAAHTQGSEEVAPVQDKLFLVCKFSRVLQVFSRLLLHALQLFLNGARDACEQRTQPSFVGERGTQLCKSKVAFLRRTVLPRAESLTLQVFAVFAPKHEFFDKELGLARQVRKGVFFALECERL